MLRMASSEEVLRSTSVSSNGSPAYSRSLPSEYRSTISLGCERNDVPPPPPSDAPLVTLTNTLIVSSARTP